MKVAILEDRPWVIWGAIDKLKNMGITDIMIIYYHGIMYNQNRLPGIEKKCQENNVELEQVDNMNFKEKLDQLYSDRERVFFFDLSMEGDGSNFFDERINVKYAREKKEQNDYRIWFYTTGGVSVISDINRNFEDFCIPVIDFDTAKNQIILDYDFIKDNVLSE